ncbi:MAG: single-stranded DNA-binding protein [Bacteroidales bacterium]|nr:single-stranded DNA-binding protein [Bacteroidales bacterium]
MNLRNRVQLVGNIGKNPVVRELNNGGKMVRFSLATNEYYMKDGERVQETTWHTLVAWGKTAEIVANYMETGAELMVGGRLKNRVYTDDKGTTRYITEVIVDEVLFRSKKDKQAA